MVLLEPEVISEIPQSQIREEIQHFPNRGIPAKEYLIEHDKTMEKVMNYANAKA